MLKRLILLFLCIIVILGASLPYLFAIEPFKQIVTSALERKIGGKVTVDTVRFSWFGPQQIKGVHLATPLINGLIEEMQSNVPFWKIKSFAKNLVQLKGSGTTNRDKGKFAIDATRNQSVTNLKLSATQMPTPLIVQLFNIDPLLKTFIGPYFDANGSASIQDESGNFNLYVSSPNTKGSIQASFTPEAITLKAPFTLSCSLTPELTSRLTKGSLFIQSKTPTYLRIEPNGFSLPRPFSLTNLQIPKANLDLGQFTLLHANLAPLASLLKADRLTASQIEMWLTNEDWSLQNGQLRLDRVDALLANSVHLCAWGNVNILQDQVDLIFGIPADTLAKSLHIQNVSSSYVLQIPVTGPIQNLNIDAGGATAKIALLIAGKKVQERGGILGGVASVITKASEEKAPPPKRPFPWE